MLYRIEVAIRHVLLQVVFAPDVVLPISALPNATLAPEMPDRIDVFRSGDAF
jgi:hypothetical protein